MRFGHLHEPLAIPPFVLLEQRATELGQGVRPRIIERSQDPLAVLDGERDGSSLEPSDFSRSERVGSSSLMSSRTSSSGIRRPARYIGLSYPVGRRVLTTDTTPPQVSSDPQPLGVDAPKLTQLGSGQGRPALKQARKLVVAYRPLL